MKNEDKNDYAGTNDIAGNAGPATPAANTKLSPGAQNTLANNLTQGETPAMTPGGEAARPAGAAGPPDAKSSASSQSLAASEMGVGRDGLADKAEKQENREANPADLTAAPGGARRGRKPGTPNKPKDGAPQPAGSQRSAPARPTDAKAAKEAAAPRGRQRKAVPEASSDQRQPDTYGGNFGNGNQPSFQDPDRYENQTSGASRGEFGAQSHQGGTHAGYGNQYREFGFENRDSAEDRYYGGPGRYGEQHNAYRDYDGRDERGGPYSQAGQDGQYGQSNQSNQRGQYGQGRSGGHDARGSRDQPSPDDHGYDRHGFNDQGGHYYGPNEGYDPRHAGGYGYAPNEPRPTHRDQGSYGASYTDHNRYSQQQQQQQRGSGGGNSTSGYSDGRGNRHDNRNQPDRDDRRAAFQNDNGAGPGRPGPGYASDYGQSSFGGRPNAGNYGGDPRGGRPSGQEPRRNQDEDGRSSRGGYDNQGSGGGRAGHQQDNGRYGQQGYQNQPGSGADERGRYEQNQGYQQGGPARDQQADPRRQPTEGYGYGHGRDERGSQPDYRTGDQRNGYGRSFGGDAQQGYGSRGGSYNDEYDNANRGQGQQGSGSPAQGDYTREDRARNYGPQARQQFRPDRPEGEESDYGSAPRRNRGRDGEDQE